MPFNGSGTFAFAGSSWAPAVASTTISVDDWNTLRTDLEAGLTACVTKAGESTTSQVIPFAAGILVNNTGLTIYDTNASHTLAITPGSNLTANRVFTLTTGDQAVTLNMSAGSLTAGGGQYVFPASQNASADANTLDDYEEGTWTPGVSFGGGTTGLTYTLQVGRYTKIGNRVLIDALIDINSNGSSTGSALLTGLPFTVLNTSNSGCAISFFADNIDASSITAIMAYLPPNGTTGDLRTFEAGNSAPMTEADLVDGSDLIFGGNYPTA